MSRSPAVDTQTVGQNEINTDPFTLLTTAFENVKPVSSGNGVSCYIILSEPVVFLTGLDQDGTNRNSQGSAMVRGSLVLKVTKSSKIKAVTLKFTGRARTDWPEGVPPEKTIYFEESSLRTQILPFFNALYEGSETGYGTQCSYHFRAEKSANSSVTNLSSNSPHQSTFSLPLAPANRTSRSNTLLSAGLSKEQKRLSLQNAQSRSFQKGESPYGSTPQQKGYKVFHPGVYQYHFELPIDNNSPETINLHMASVKWQLEAIVERAGTFKSDLQGFKEIPVVRSPSEDSLELIEPISISRKWEDQLQYEIMISGKAFPLGSKIPIAFKLTPLDKCQIHRIKVYVSETVEYFTNNRRVTRKEMTKKLLLLDKVAGKPLNNKDFPGSVIKINSGGEQDPEIRRARQEYAARNRAMKAERNNEEVLPLPPQPENILGDLDLGEEAYIVQTEMEMEAALPTCEMMEKERSKRLVPDCTWKNANVHHWIKIVMRISKYDNEGGDSTKRRHFEISIDSPFTILNCRATQANLALPMYTGLNTTAQDQQRTCGCPGAAPSNTRTVSPTLTPVQQSALDNMPVSGETAIPALARPPQAHVHDDASAIQRPMHLLRQPSFLPPAFDAEDPPPSLPTPPPQYDHVIGTPSVDGMADYFNRYNHEYDEADDDDDNRAFTRGGRVNVPHPRTPGGRLARSMDLDREFMLQDLQSLRLMAPGPPEAGNNDSVLTPAT